MVKKIDHTSTEVFYRDLFPWLIGWCDTTIWTLAIIAVLPWLATRAGPHVIVVFSLFNPDGIHSDNLILSQCREVPIC